MSAGNENISDRMSMVFWDAPCMMAITTGDEGRFIEVNRRFEGETGYSRDELVGRTVAECTALISPDEWIDIQETVVKDTLLSNRPLTYRTKSGMLRSGLISGAVQTLGEDSSVIWVVNDMAAHKDRICRQNGKALRESEETYRGLAEEEKEELKRRFLYDRKMEAVGALAGGVAHDLNNVLTGLVSLPELMLMEIPEDSPLREPLRTIRKSGEKAATMVQELLTLARRGVKADRVVNMNRIIEEYLQTPEYALLRHYHPHVEFEVRLDTNLHNIKGSSAHLAKTVMTLLSNASEAIGRGDGYVRLITENRRVKERMATYGRIKEGDYAVLTVSDTGIGMSPVDRERIFEPFYTKKVLGRSGTGLGMAVVWGCVQDHKGHIDLESGEGKGSTFTLYFPAVDEVLHEEEHRKTATSCGGKGELILVVDDVAEQREVASLILSTRGYSVATVSGGEEALEYLEKSGADVVLLDMIMDPGIDGLETFKRIFSKNPDQKVIIVSGYSESAQVKEALQHGAAGCVTKPYRIETLVMAIGRALDRYDENAVK